MKVDCLKAMKEVKDIIDSDDLLMRNFNFDGTQAGLVYIDGMSDKLLIEQDIIRPLILKNEIKSDVDFLQTTLFYGEKIKQADTIAQIAEAVATGEIAFFIDGADSFYILSLKKYNFRSVEEPPTETVLKGPREGFIEDIKTNITLIRRKLRSPNLRIKQFKVGRYSATIVCLAYIEGIVAEETVKKISEKISKIDIDGIIETTYIQSFVEDNSYTFFNQSGITEKPDIVSSKLLEGRVAILVDGSPMVITVPYMLFESFQDGYDYYARDARTSMIRVFRLIGALFSVFLPGMFVALQEYHYHLLPLKFLITILNSVSGIPFTSPMEMLFVLTLFEILHQASVRMPRYVGTAMSIVGAIVLGQTAVNAGLLSSPAVLIIAISAIGINCVPDLVDSFSLLRLGVLLVGSVLGLYGIIVMIVMLVAYLGSMESYGTPYLAPYSPIITSDFKDSLFKENLKNIDERPYSIPTKNRRRLKNNE